jgi:hypothetical protein
VNLLSRTRSYSEARRIVLGIGVSVVLGCCFVAGDEFNAIHVN